MVRAPAKLLKSTLIRAMLGHEHSVIGVVTTQDCCERGRGWHSGTWAAVAQEQGEAVRRWRWCREVQCWHDGARATMRERRLEAKARGTGARAWARRRETTAAEASLAARAQWRLYGDVSVCG